MSPMRAEADRTTQKTMRSSINLKRMDTLTLRIAYSLFAQKPGEELKDYTRWLGMTKPGAGSDLLRVNGAGENLAWSAADFENFLQPRP